MRDEPNVDEITLPTTPQQEEWERLKRLHALANCFHPSCPFCLALDGPPVNSDWERDQQFKLRTTDPEG